MESRRLPSPSTEKKLKRREILERKKAIDQLIKSAYAQTDHLASFPPFRHYQRNGVSVRLDSGCGDKLSTSEKQYIQHLLKVNMEGPYGSEWPSEEKLKRREMVAAEARYILVREGDTLSASASEDKGPLVGFVHYRFTLEEEVPVLYLYELQLEPHLQRKGLGKFLMQLIELIARKNCMGAVALTVQKTNLLAMNFYLSKLRYIISSISPSRIDPLTGADKSYEILCKVFDNEYRTALEELFDE